MNRNTIIGLVAGVVIGSAVMFGGGRLLNRGPGADAIVDTTLTSVQELNRLTVFAAVLTTTATSKTDGPLGIDMLGTRKTVIVPGTVRYDVDFGRVSRRDVSWDAATRTLTIAVADPIVGEPAVDLRRLVTFKDGELVMVIAGNEATLDAANAKAATDSLRTMANAPLLRGMARKAGRQAIASNFELPLRAAGIDAKVRVRFPGEPV